MLMSLSFAFYKLKTGKYLNIKHFDWSLCLNYIIAKNISN